MIVLERSDRHTVYLRFDLQGAAELHACCIKARVDPDASVPIILDLRVFSHSRVRKEVPAWLALTRLDEECEASIRREGEQVCLELPEDTLDELLTRLAERNSPGAFWSPEWITVRETKPGRQSDIHCILTR